MSRIFAVGAVLVPGSVAVAAPSQDEVLRSIGRNVGGEIDPSKLLAVLLVIVAIVIVVILVNVGRKRALVPKVVNSPGKLLKEVSRSINLRPAELKQLKLLADDRQLISPLILLLCPSVLVKSAKETNVRIDKTVLANVARRLATRPNETA